MPKTPEELEKEITSLSATNKAYETEIHALKDSVKTLTVKSAGLEGQLAAQGQTLVEKNKEIETLQHSMKDLTAKERKKLEEAVHAIDPTKNVEGVLDEALHCYLEGAEKQIEKQKKLDEEKASSKPETAKHGVPPPKTPKASESAEKKDNKRMYQ